jgi:hypothetical protein
VAEVSESMQGVRDAGAAFLEWVREGLGSEQLAMNSPQAHVHRVAEGLLLLSPALFQAFDGSTWTEVQKRFQKLKLHRKAAQGTNTHTYLASGDAKPGSALKGFLIPNPEAVFPGITLPPPSPHFMIEDDRRSAELARAARDALFQMEGRATVRAGSPPTRHGGMISCCSTSRCPACAVRQCSAISAGSTLPSPSSSSLPIPHSMPMQRSCFKGRWISW